MAVATTMRARSLLLGGETCAWGTVVNKDNLEEVSWQGTVAVAERLWSPTPADVAQAVRCIFPPVSVRGLGTWDFWLTIPTTGTCTSIQPVYYYTAVLLLW